MLDNLVINELNLQSEDYPKFKALREKILRLPLGLKLDNKDLENDKNSFLFGAYLNNIPSGFVMLQKTNSTSIRLRQMCIEEKLQGQGIGKKLVEFAEFWSESNGYNEITMSARVEAENFYLKIGYKKTSAPYNYLTIPHIDMYKKL